MFSSRQGFPVLHNHPRIYKFDSFESPLGPLSDHAHNGAAKPRAHSPPNPPSRDFCTDSEPSGEEQVCRGVKVLCHRHFGLEEAGGQSLKEELEGQKSRFSKNDEVRTHLKKLGKPGRGCGKGKINQKICKKFPEDSSRNSSQSRIASRRFQSSCRKHEGRCPAKCP